MSDTEKQRQLVKAFKSVFVRNTDGKIVLEALKDEYYDTIPRPKTAEEALWAMAQREVIRNILDITEQADG